MKYAEKLKDPRWQKKRLEVFERDGWKCRECGCSDETLAVHHVQYFPNTEPWDYPDDSLKTMCEFCHNEEREIRPDYERWAVKTLREAGWTASSLHALVNLISTSESHRNKIVFLFDEFVVNRAGGGSNG